ncbi:hypothetical protein QFZ70_003295 [Arthrobacter sp. V1I9]|nr:hypothetical protein [Arthrobacter sp. V1I9]
MAPGPERPNHGAKQPRVLARKPLEPAVAFSPVVKWL